jgi:hypothetical protein
MNVTQIAITRKFYLGNYQTLDIHLEADLCGENPVGALHALEKDIMDYWEGRATSPASKPIADKDKK